MALRPGDEEKMRRALGVPDAMTKATGSDIDPAKAAELGQKADRDEQADRARQDDWNRDEPAPVSGS